MRRYKCLTCGNLFGSVSVIPCPKCMSFNCCALLPEGSGGLETGGGGTPAIVNTASREKAERIAFVKRVSESLLPKTLMRSMEEAIKEAEKAYDKLKEWESKQ